MRKKHGLGDALSAGAHQAAAEQSYGPVMAALTQLFDAGKKDGSIRQDAEPADFLQLTGALWRAATTPRTALRTCSRSSSTDSPPTRSRPNGTAEQAD
ncbi:hypothetical protein ACFQZC_35995 [Streptacidiphilus monticola]